eukprot:12078007-Karenia_brevis.AAC.1
MLQRLISSSATSPKSTSNRNVPNTFVSSQAYKTQTARTSGKQVLSAQDSYLVLNAWPTQAYKQDIDVTGAGNIAVTMSCLLMKHCLMMGCLHS